MRGIVVTASQVPTRLKMDIKRKVGFMGGIYTSNLAESTTHLVTNAVRSSKYEIASQKGIPAMMVEWIEALWEQSKIRNIKATDPEFMKKYKVPIFLNMFITCSNLSKEEKGEVKKLVTQNGGTFTPQLRQHETTLLVVNEARGEKYKHARSWDLPCVLPSYITQSVREGYALPSAKFLIVPSVKSSTPTKGDDIPNFTYNSESSLSMINFDSSKTHIEDTQLNNCTQQNFNSQLRQSAKPSGSHHALVLQNLNVSEAKKAGSFVDGCKIFLSGFSGAEGEKLRRILSLGGATVFSELSESVSHFLVGEFIVQDMRAVTELAQKPHMVTLDWLAASIKQHSPAAEEPFYCMETQRLLPEPPSPLSQKGMQLLQPAKETNDVSKMPPPAEPVSRKLFSEFVKENARSPAKHEAEPHTTNCSVTRSNNSSQDYSIIPEILLGLKILVAGFDSEMTADIEAAVQAAGGCIVAGNFTGVADYAVVPLQTAVPNITAVEVVTDLWLKDCLDRAELVSVQYYHQPLTVDPDKRPLADCCISLSNYFSKEKAFLIELVQVLGATYQDVFARVTKKGVLPSTHLVCPKADGQKYKAAIRWGLPAVSKEWLITCARLGIKVPEANYNVTGLNGTLIGSTAEQGQTPKPVLPSTVSDPSTFTTPASSTFHSPGPSSAMPSEPETPQFVHPAVTCLKRKSSALTPDDQSPFHVSTPNTPYGVFDTPTTESKKRWKKFIDDFPSKTEATQPSTKIPRRQSTPLSELRRKIWAAACETSDENVNPNFSIEEMDDNPSVDSEDNRVSTPVGGESQIRRLSAGRSTPTVNDFRSVNKTPSNLPRTSNTDIQSAKSSNNLSNDASSSKCNVTPKSAKKSPANEMVCAMLNQLHQRLSTPSSVAEEPQPLPQRELVCPVDQPVPSTKPVATSMLPESQPNLIGWEDPVESAERAKVQSKSSPTLSAQSFKPRKFVLSSVTEREKYEGLLKSLGETVITEPVYDNQTTHLIVDQPVRSEKLLCCLAAGKWILHTSYIDRMVECNKYLPEEEKFEWGNPLSAGNLPALSPTSLEHQLANAAVRWRRQLSGGMSGAFTGVVAMLIASPSKYDSYRRLIEAGGGQIVASTLILQATHCFVEMNRVSTMPLPLSQFVDHKVPCLLPVFLGEMLTKFPSPDIQKNLIPEYRRLLDLQS